jgi:hypothetical protein
MRCREKDYILLNQREINLSTILRRDWEGGGGGGDQGTNSLLFILYVDSEYIGLYILCDVEDAMRFVTFLMKYSCMMCEDELESVLANVHSEHIKMKGATDDRHCVCSNIDHLNVKVKVFFYETHFNHTFRWMSCLHTYICRTMVNPLCNHLIGQMSSCKTQKRLMGGGGGGLYGWALSEVIKHWRIWQELWRTFLVDMFTVRVMTNMRLVCSFSWLYDSVNVRVTIYSRYDHRVKNRSS